MLEVFYYPPPLVILMLLTPVNTTKLNPIHLHSTGMEMELKDEIKAICIAWYHYSKMRKCILMIWVNRPFKYFALRHSRRSQLTIMMGPHPSSLFHPLVCPALIQALISTLIPVLFQEHRDCLMIYWPDPPICTVNHNVPSTKEEHALLSRMLPLNSCPPTSSTTSLHALWLHV